MNANVKAAAGCHHVDRGRLERELGREHELAVVRAALVGRVGRAVHHIVPEYQV